MWFISHYVTEIIEFQFNRCPPAAGRKANLSQKVKRSILLLGFRLRQSNECAYAPTDGRLAAAMATIWDSRRPIRDGAPRSNERICCISHLPSAPVEQSFQQWRTIENGLARQTSRDVCENSNARTVRTPAGSGFIAPIEPAAGEIFSPVSALIIR
ncbi:hypothetical protein [Afipia sp. GAS231]|uniref:hypothetical protein n=1 Tax=Afipia sp. GAS231 TaxID=1882747 RepID=UPI0012FADA86|nr:hypothetical protein [Afipia sp. GAS231]